MDRHCYTDAPTHDLAFLNCWNERDVGVSPRRCFFEFFYLSGKYNSSDSFFAAAPSI